jgi:hypothetical protein
LRHLALIGDSILDNIHYTAPDPDTTDWLRRSVGSEWTVELLARDGGTMADIGFQVGHLPTETDTAVLSIGGNDALEHIGILEERAATSAEVLSHLARIADDFGSRYRQVITDLGPRVRRLIVCTIYEPPLLNPAMARLARVPLALLNDQIIRAAARAGADVLDIRTVCTEASDFVMEIEPSAGGARKIAAAIDGLIRGTLPRPPITLFTM